MKTRFCNFPLYTCRPAGALVSRSLAFLHTFRPSGAFNAGARGISIALVIHSLDYTLQNVLFKQVLSDLFSKKIWLVLGVGS